MTNNTCKVNGCICTTGLVNGICAKCRKRLNKKPKKRPKIRKESTREWSKWLKKAKMTFQRLRRVQEADENGYCKCVCGSWRKWNACDAGHFIPAKKLGTCFNPTNVHPQTKQDNLDMDNPIVSQRYMNFMIEKYGQEHIDKLVYESNQIAKFTVPQFKILVELWENEIKEIIIKKKLS